MTPFGILKDPGVGTGTIIGDRAEALKAKTPKVETSKAEIYKAKTFRVKAAVLGGIAVSISFASLTLLLSPVEVEALKFFSKNEIGLP